MANLTQLRIAAREIFDEALRAADPTAAMRANLRVDGSSLHIGESSTDIRNQKIYSIAIGKAAAKMAAGLNEILGERLSAAVLTTNDTRLKANHLGNKWRIFHGGHPEPNESSLAAADAAFELLDRANQEQALLIFLVSGGGSAMIERPVNETISLEALKAANRLMVNCGASISEINSVRRAFSAIKGGKLAARAPACYQISLIVSDVPHGEERNVASGPTVAPPKNALKPDDVVARYNLRSQLPRSIIQAIDDEESLHPVTGTMCEHLVLLTNSDLLLAVASVARKRDFIVEIAPDISDQRIQEGCDLLLKRLEALRVEHHGSDHGVCLISGGEFACPVQGSGLGGRNLESALRLARSRNMSDTVALCAGTDGIDGNSPAAGAIIDSTTIDRATAIGLEVEDFLRRSDSYSFLVALGDVIATGPTGTNVRDVRILLSKS